MEKEGGGGSEGSNELRLEDEEWDKMDFMCVYIYFGGLVGSFNISKNQQGATKTNISSPTDRKSVV